MDRSRYRPIRLMSLVFAALLAATFLVACETASAPPIETGDLTSLSNGCVAVEFNTSTAGIPQTGFEGTMSGDLEGSIETTFDLDNFKFSGLVIHAPGMQRFEVSGGTIPELVGETLLLDFHSVAVVAPTFLHAKINGAGKIVDSPVSGHLTFHGVQDSSILPTQAEIYYHGNLCPIK